MDWEDVDTTTDLSAECASVRRKMRLRLLQAENAELMALYYRAITLSEHEAARRAIANLPSGAGSPAIDDEIPF